MTVTADSPLEHDEAFVHEALLYSDEDDFVDGSISFIHEGLSAGEAVLVAVDAAKIERLRAELGADAGRVLFADMAEIGANPARIIAAWQQFVTEQGSGGRAVRGIGEPVWPGRSDAEVVECQRHEELLNLAFAGAPAFRLLCPYDTGSLDESVIAEALRSHPYVAHGRERAASPDYVGLDQIARPFGRPLSDPPAESEELSFDEGMLPDVRGLVQRRAVAAGIELARVNSVVLSVNEIATNSVRHGGGEGLLKVWEAGDAFVCEVTDRGRIADPLVGRSQPELDRPKGRGLWLANQLCDLVQVRTFEGGNTVRIYMSRD
jgi:anti-sigma regulatory factor (Ser/Thr protein kinase)